MLKSPPAFGKVPLLKKAETDKLATEKETREILQGKQSSVPDIRLQKYNKLHTQIITKFAQLLHLPQPGEFLFLLSAADLNAYTLVLWFGQQIEIIDELYISTYNINHDIIRAFGDLLDSGKVRNLTIIMSQSIEAKKSANIEALRQMWYPRRDRVRVSLCWNHSKLMLVRPSGSEARYMVSGSANFSHNAKL